MSKPYFQEIFGIKSAAVKGLQSVLAALFPNEDTIKARFSLAETTTKLNITKRSVIRILNHACELGFIKKYKNYLGKTKIHGINYYCLSKKGSLFLFNRVSQKILKNLAKVESVKKAVTTKEFILKENATSFSDPVTFLHKTLGKTKVRQLMRAKSWKLFKKEFLFVIKKKERIRNLKGFTIALAKDALQGNASYPAKRVDKLLQMIKNGDSGRTTLEDEVIMSLKQLEKEGYSLSKSTLARLFYKENALQRLKTALKVFFFKIKAGLRSPLQFLKWCLFAIENPLDLFKKGFLLARKQKALLFERVLPFLQKFKQKRNLSDKQFCFDSYKNTSTPYIDIRISDPTYPNVFNTIVLSTDDQELKQKVKKLFNNLCFHIFPKQTTIFEKKEELIYGCN